MKRIAVIALLASTLHAQVYSPKVLLDGEPDTTDLASLTATLYQQAHANTQREKAEAIWRYLLTDGRFVKPGVFYHIPGWSYEEPMGEVLDPVKLLNSYGFGLCYQDAPLLQALWEAGGFSHTRVWFLTGHTVAEVFYAGAYHYYDSDMMGYTTVGDRSYKTAPVASVVQLEHDPQIILSKLEKPRTVKPGAVDYPWYNADVRADAVKDLSDLFTTSDDNYLYAYRRYPQGHTMDFVLRPGERIIRYYQNPDKGLRYMPYSQQDGTLEEFPKDVGDILKIANGPRSEKDTRLWSTGLIEYMPTKEAIQSARNGKQQTIFRMASPYIIIGATFQWKAAENSETTIETSTDEGHTWIKAATPTATQNGMQHAQPLTQMTSEHGTKNAVAGSYGYLVRFTAAKGPDLQQLKLTTLFEFNPRTLPELKPGQNRLTYTHSSQSRHELPVHASNAKEFATSIRNAWYSSEQGQGYWRNEDGRSGEITIPITALAGTGLTSFSVGGRFLDIRGGLAPNKLTAEVRKVKPWPSNPEAQSTASISWSQNPNGPWKSLWIYDPNVTWADGQQIAQMLRWPEVDKTVDGLAAGTKTVYVRFRFENLALDDIRLASIQPADNASQLTITHLWLQDGEAKAKNISFSGNAKEEYNLPIPSGSEMKNTALILSAK